MCPGRHRSVAWRRSPSPIAIVGCLQQQLQVELKQFSAERRHGSEHRHHGWRTATAAASSSVSLAGICPNPIIAQTDWNPESDDFGVLRGGRSRRDGRHQQEDLYSGAHRPRRRGHRRRDPVRSGGPATGNQLNSALLYEDQSILLGFVETDEAIENSRVAADRRHLADRLHRRRSSCGTRRPIPKTTRSPTSARTAPGLVLQRGAVHRLPDGGRHTKSGQVDGPTTARRPGSSPRVTRRPSRASPPLSPTSISTRSHSG